MSKHTRPAPVPCPSCLGTGRVPDHARLGCQARNRRQAYDLNQIELARRMRISVTYLSELERGRRKWNLELWRKLVEGCRKGKG